MVGTPIQYFLSDTPYPGSGGSGGSPGVPPCTGNNLHKTLVSLLGVAAAPDLLGSSLPSGVCTDSSSGVPTPTTPCYALDLSGGCQGVAGPGLPSVPIGGLPFVPTGSASCGSPPLDNTKSHSWVTPGVPAGTTINLKGTGSMTAYLMSGSGVAVNVNVCLGLYIVPGGLLGSLLGNLLSTPIGATVTASVTAQAGVPTPVSFNFNVGSAGQIVGSLLGTRIEVVVWLAASASTNVSLAYDQAQFASQLTLMSS
jgi:hypothetical protein